MEKKQLKTIQMASVLALRKETLRRLADRELRGVAGGGRLRVPGGFYDDTTPIYIEVEES
jgi:hypothetical protein